MHQAGIVAGVFAAGDVEHKKFVRPITAVGGGYMAALQAEQCLSDHP